MDANLAKAMYDYLESAAADKDDGNYDISLEGDEIYIRTGMRNLFCSGAR